MKKLQLIVLCAGLMTLFFACQKTVDSTSSIETSDEILSCSGGGGVHESPPPLECGNFRTQSQGGWGSYPYGNNPGEYLHDHFAAAFPSGFTIGCAENGASISFTSASAITKFLPASGSPAVLTSSAIDPRNGSIKNVLIGQVAALALNVGFDFYDNNFSPAEERLGNLQIVSGPFAGKSVSEFLSISNAVIGGCNTEYSTAAVNQTASAINANFLDGKSNGGILSCPVTRLTKR